MARNPGAARLCSLPGLQGRILPLSPPAPGAAHGPGRVASRLPSLPPRGHHLLFCEWRLPLCLPLLRTPLIAFGVHPAAPAFSPRPKTIHSIPSAVDLSHQVAQVPGVKTWYLWETFFHLFLFYLIFKENREIFNLSKQ